MMLQRNTIQRRVILEELRKLTSHPTAREMYEVVRRKLPNISLGTVYRNLDLLSRVGLILKLRFANRETRFDGDLKRHYHVRCTNCGRVEDVVHIDTSIADEALPKVEGWKIVGKRVEYVGQCSKCQTEENIAN